MTEPLAIIGMACRLPGADGLDAFWRLVVERRTAWEPLPESRFRRDLYYDPKKGTLGRSYSDIGGLVPDRPVDRRVCPLSDDLVERYDISHHLFLEVASLACRDAGLDPFAMPAGRCTGVYVGHTGGSTRIGDIVYANGIEAAADLLGEVEVARRILREDARVIAREVAEGVRRRYPGRTPGQRLNLGALGAAAIVREALRLSGPYLVVDAACASSLQALAIAARALLQGGIDQAIVGGASYCKSDSLVLFSAAQSVSASGSCPFGEAADGLVTAEGYVSVVLKTLSRAVADGDRIRAVIRGLGVASDGKGKSLWAPRQEGQIAAVERAYSRQEDLGRLEYIETHATSTQVGDATELAALARVMAGHVPPGRKLPIGSVKANIGHTLETAGIASLVKVVLSLEHGLIPPGSTCQELSRAFDWQRGPFVVPDEPQPWPGHADGTPRLAAVNAFGIGGLNIHLAIEEHLPGAARPRPARVDRDPDRHAIAIVGAGCILPGSLTREAFFARLEGGESAIGPVPADRWDPRGVLDPSRPRTWHVTSAIGGFVRDFAYDWRRHKVPPKQIAAANPLQFMLLEAADEALADAGGPAAVDRKRTAVVVGTLFGGDFSNQLQMGLRLPETVRLLAESLERRGIDRADRERIVAEYEKIFLDRMPALVDETGSFTSSTLASRLTKTFDLMGGALALDAGDCSSVAALAAAADMLREGHCDAVLCAAGERCLDLMSYEGRSLGESLARRPASVLDECSAGGDVPAEGAVVFVLKRLADARAAGNTIRGVIRGIGIGARRSVGDAVERAIERAHRDAGLDPAVVRAVQVATAAGHEKSGQELVALGAAYGGGGPQAVVGAIDGLIGHTGAAAGAAGLLALMPSLRAGSLPGTAALSVARREVHGLAAASGRLPIAALTAGSYRAGSVTVVHDEQAGHVVVDNGESLPAAAPQQRPVAAARPEPVPTAASPARPLVAALFPGQGSQYVDMFRELAGLPEAAAVIAELDASARRAGHETLGEIAWHDAAGLGLKVWDTQWSMFLGDLFAWGILQRLGLEPDVIASHSFGEFPALVAAGAWSFATGARAARARADAVERHAPRDGAMLSIIAERPIVDWALEPFRDRVWLCAENAPQQFVVGGVSRDVDVVEALLDARRVKSKRLAVPSPFHTPLLAAAADELGRVVTTLPIDAPRTPTLGSTGADLLADAGAIRASLVAQMTGTVRWIGTVQRLYQMGVRTFVEVGPSGVLTGLTRRALEGKDDVRFMQFDQRGRPAREAVDRLVAQLGEAGVVREVVSGPAVPAEPAGPARRPGRVRSFDATARRRDRNRSTAAGRAGSQSEAPEPRVPQLAGRGITELLAATAVNGNGHPPTAPQPLSEPHRGGVRTELSGRVGAPPAPRPVPAAAVTEGPAARGHGRTTTDPAPRPAAEVSVPAVSAAAAAGARQSRAAAGTSAGELETFLVDFVVEQTGYPREIVELDADLEADLGIDSIRKAQLVGEIGIRYGLSADDDVSLDAFPTLRHLLEYLLPRVGNCRAAVPEEPAAPGHGRATTDPAPRPAAEVSVPAVSAAAAAGARQSGAAAGELETFLVDFVVEQTGYPREIVELDADLEADLGIDSIRKAQLVGEIGIRYGLSADDDVSLDAFPTLRHLLEYLLPRVGNCRAAAAAPPADHGWSPESGQGMSDNGFAEPEDVAWGDSWSDHPDGRESALAPAKSTATAVATGRLSRAGDIRAAAPTHWLTAPAGVAWERLVVAPAAGPGLRGALVCLGRHANPAAERFASGGLCGTLVRLSGVEGAIAGWNDAGLLVVAAPVGYRGAAAAAVEAVVTRCRDLPAARDALAAAGKSARGLVITDLRSGGVHEVDALGRLAALPAGFTDAGRPSALTGIALADGTRDGSLALEHLLRDQGSSSVRLAAALSSACVWFAVGTVDDAAVCRSGGPLAGDWLESGAGQAMPREAPAERGHAGQMAAAETHAPITRRYRLEAVDRAPCRGVRVFAGERIMLLGDDECGPPLALALETVGALPSSAALGSDADAVRAVEDAERTGPVRHLVVLAGRPRAGDARGWTERCESMLAAAYFACQRWVVARLAAGGLGGATLTAVVDLGGDFGLSGRMPTAVGGGIAGLFKGLAREFPDLHVRVLDAPESMTAAVVAEAVVAEMCDAPGPVETGLLPPAGGTGGVRRVTVVPREAPLPPGGRAPAALSRRSVWLVAGGARGVTAACALELGRRHGVSLVLVGSTRPSDVEASWVNLDEAGRRELMADVMRQARQRGDDPRASWRLVEKSLEIRASLADFARAGIEVRYMPCDLADAAAVRRLVAQVEAEVGPIRGIVHGAGQESACRFERKTRAGFSATVGPKCLGLEHLMAAVDPGSLECVVAFGSTSGRLGGLGQADYSLANDLLAKSVAAWRVRRPGLRAATFHWHAWGEVGMAYRPESRLALERLGLHFMPLAEGVRRFSDEIEAGLPIAEVLVTEPAMCPEACPVADAPLAEPRGSLVERVESHGATTDVRFELAPTTDRFLIEHVLHGRPLLPAVMGLEILAQAARAAGACGPPVEVRDFVVERPLDFPDDQPRDVRVEVTAEAGGTRVRGRARPVTGLDRTVEWVHFHGVVRDGGGEPIVAAVGEPPFPFNPMIYQDDAPLVHGPAFRALKDLYLDRSGGWGRLVAPRDEGVARPRGREGWTVPVELLDGALVACAVYSYLLCGRRVEIPVRIGRVRFGSRPAAGEKCRMRLLLGAQTPRESVYDFVMVGSDDRPLLAVEGLHLAIVSEDEA